jgi:hypothetical protein
MKNVEESRYLNLLTDFGFKRTLAQEENKPLLISLLNAIIQDREKIDDILYLQTEQPGKRSGKRFTTFTVKMTRGND